MKTLDTIPIKYPLLYSHCTYFECGDGWYDIINELSKKIERLLEKTPKEEREQCYAIQIKEKFGGLRFYMSSMTDEIDNLITEAETLSLKTCELCGKPGELRKGGWVTVKCEECNAK